MHFIAAKLRQNTVKVVILPQTIFVRKNNTRHETARPEAKQPQIKSKLTQS